MAQTSETAAGVEPPVSGRKPVRRRRVHRAWFVAAVTFVTIIGAAAFRSVPGLFIAPLYEEFGWSRGTIGAAVSVNLALYGLTAPFAAALMDRYGIRRVVAAALTVIALGSGLTVWMTATVPPTLALCREHYGDDSPIVFGWVLASHQVGAAVVAFVGGVARDTFGGYDVAWQASGALCAAALMALVIRRRPDGRPAVAG
ncbi:MFS transporter [Streptomyces sp. NPDC006996]|uniref:MFS transporter n=1 Tax=Streptomyces sp. NPDC006996 TaxID=3156908 RepID=UPI0033D46D2A